MKSLDYVLKRLHRLSDTLGELKERVREAIAGELSRVVANTVQDVVQSFVRGQPIPEPQHHSPPSRPHWQEEEDRWAEDDEYPRDEREYDPDPPDDEPPPEPPVHDRWQRAVEIGTTVLRWCMASCWKPLIGFGVAGLAGAATWYGGPAIHAGTSLVLSAAELISFGTAHSLR